MTSSGRWRRMAAARSRLSASPYSMVPSGWSRNSTSVTPTTAALSRCSLVRTRALSAGSIESMPASPLLASRYATRLPCPVQRATAAAPPYSRSSGCATIASARSQSSGSSASCWLAVSSDIESNLLPLRLHEPAGDDLEAEGLVGALEDRQHPGVDEVAADGVLLRVAEAAVDLHGLAGHPLRGLADVRLHHRRLHRALPLGHQPGHGVGELPGGLDGHRHAGELGPGELVVGDRPAEDGPVARVLPGILVRRLHHADGPRRGLQPAVLEAGHLQVEAPAEAVVAADQAGVGHEPVVERDLVGVHAAVADGVDRPALHAAAPGRPVGTRVLRDLEAAAVASVLGDDE